MNRLILIDAPHFYVGVEVNDKGTIVRAAPIIRWSVGKQLTTVLSYWMRKGFKVEEIRS